MFQWGKKQQTIHKQNHCEKSSLLVSIFKSTAMHIQQFLFLIMQINALSSLYLYMYLHICSVTHPYFEALWLQLIHSKKEQYKTVDYLV